MSEFEDSDEYEEKKQYKCLGCPRTTSEDDFEYIDDELNHRYPRCPDCQSAHRISGETCDCGCDKPATHEVELGFLCDDCYEDYVSGYIRD